MYVGSLDFATLRQFPHLGGSSLAATPRIPAPSQGSAAENLRGCPRTSAARRHTRSRGRHR
jgi:hypothetical protein